MNLNPQIVYSNSKQSKMNELFDFHLHPFIDPINSIARYGHPADLKEFLEHLQRHGITHCAGSVIHHVDGSDFKEIQKMNEESLKIRDIAPDGFYYPGIHIHPNFPEESCNELQRMHSEGVRLIGELVPYVMNYTEYCHPGLEMPLKIAADLGMVLSIHSGAIEDMEAMIARNPKLNVVMAHPGEYASYMEKIELCKNHQNAFIDICGTGLFRHRMLEYGIKILGAERFLFATDFPTCNVGMQIGAIKYADITDNERMLVCSGNARRLLGV